MSTRQGQGMCVRIYIGESDQWHGKPLYAAIIQKARSYGLAGATAHRGIMGFGARGTVHEPHLFSLSRERPVVVEIVDSEATIQRFLPRISTMVSRGIITTSRVEVATYTAKN